jgi:hypothetical protein
MRSWRYLGRRAADNVNHRASARWFFRRLKHTNSVRDKGGRYRVRQLPQLGGTLCADMLGDFLAVFP